MVLLEKFQIQFLADDQIFVPKPIEFAIPTAKDRLHRKSCHFEKCIETIWLDRERSWCGLFQNPERSVPSF